MNLAVAVVAVLFAGMGLAALVRPSRMGSFFDVRFESVDGRNEVRAVYGGFGLAMAAALFVALHTPALRSGIIICVAFALGGMASGRLISSLIELPGFWPWFFCGLEASLAGLLCWAA